MKGEKEKSVGGLFSRFRAKVTGEGDKDQQEYVESEETHIMLEEFEAVKKHPGKITGWDFDRAFEFIERYPDSQQAEILIGQMYATSGSDLKGLSYPSAVKVLDRMSGHPGAQSIINGMYKIERDFIQELRSDVIAYMLKVIPDHPLADELTTALATKNLTNAYDFITTNPDNPYTEKLIRAMFDRDANIAVLLLQEKMDHPKVDSIFEGIYNITKDLEIEKLTPNAVIFILEVAPDHPKALKMAEVLVDSNYVKAYEFIDAHQEFSLIEEMKELIVKRKPELQKLFDKE